MAAFWAPIILFSKLADEIIERETILLDKEILLLIHSHSTVFYNNFFFVITFLGNFALVAPIGAIIASLLWHKKQLRDALIVFMSVAGASLANIILKMLFYRERPAFWPTMVHEAGYSFPSGHAMISSALIFSLIFIAWKTRARWWVTIGGGLLIFLIGLSRLYLGVHYPTDIIAGWSASFFWVLIVYAVARGYSYHIHHSDKPSI